MFVVCIGGGGKPVHVVVRKGSEDLRHAFARLSEVRASGLFSARAAREKCGMYLFMLRYVHRGALAERCSPTHCNTHVQNRRSVPNEGPCMRTSEPPAAAEGMDTHSGPWHLSALVSCVT